MDEPIHIRTRMICLTHIGPESQAQEACNMLRGINGVLHAQPISSRRISLTYSLQDLSFELIEALLKELGFYLDNSIFAIIRRNIYQYLEDNVREKIQAEQNEQVLVCHLNEELLHDEPEKYWNNYR
jgi:hypothetical protein